MMSSSMSSSSPATSSSTSLIEQISVELLVCRMCNDTLRRPKTLACRHSFCEGCLYELRGRDLQQQPTPAARTSSDLYLSCPVCQTRSLVPPGGIRRLPDDTIVTRLSDVIERRRKSPSAEGDSYDDRDGTNGRKYCEICVPVTSGHSRRKVASCRCLECTKLLCSTCARLHRKTNVTSGHSLLDLDSVTSSFCRFHESEQVRFYCDQCDACVCVLCTYGDHAGHAMTSFSEAIESQRSSLQDITDQCKVHLKKVQSYLDVVERCQTEISQAENAINEAAIEAVTSIRQRERDLLAALRVVLRRSSAIGDSNSSSDAQDRKLLADCCKRLNENCRSAERMMSDLNDGSSAAAFLLARTNLIDRMTSTLDEMRTCRSYGPIAANFDHNNGNQSSLTSGSVSFIPFGIKSAMAMLLGRLSVQQSPSCFCSNGLIAGNSGGDENRNDFPVSFEDSRSGNINIGNGCCFEDLVTFTTSDTGLSTGLNSDLTKYDKGSGEEEADEDCELRKVGDLQQQQQLSGQSRRTTSSKTMAETRNVDVQTDDIPTNSAATAGNCDASGSGVMTSRSVNGFVRQSETNVASSTVEAGNASCWSGRSTRRVQTDGATYRDKSTETFSCPTDDKSTSCVSGSLVSVDRSTMTTVVYRGPGRDRSTSTDWLIVTREQETSTLPPVLISSGTQADRPKTRCRAIDAIPETANKATSTSSFSNMSGSVDGGQREDQQRVSQIGLRTISASSAKMVDVCVGGDDALPTIEHDASEVNPSVDAEILHQSDNITRTPSPSDASNTSAATELSMFDKPNKLRSNFAQHVSFEGDQPNIATESEPEELSSTGKSNATSPSIDSGGGQLVDLMNRLTELMPEIVRTADVLAASNFSSAMTARLLSEIAGIGKQLQTTLLTLPPPRDQTQDVATNTDLNETVTRRNQQFDDDDTENISTVDCAVGDSSASVVDSSTVTCQPEVVDCASGPDGLSPPRTVDCGVGDSVVTTSDSSTLMTSRPATFDKETSTKHGHLVHKNIGTDSQLTADKQTSTQTTDVAAAYLGSTVSRRTLTVSRGTCTPPYQPAPSATLTGQTPSTTERGSSPIRVQQVDKAVSANKAEALEPVDTFQAPQSPRSRRGQLVASPRSKLAAINEAADDEVKVENDDNCSANAADDEEKSSLSVLPPMSSVSSRLVAARSQTRNVRCGVTSLPLGRQRPSLPCTLLNAPQLSRNVFNFDNLLEAAASRQVSSSTLSSAAPMVSRYRLSANVPTGRLTSMQSKSNSLPDFTRLNLPTFDLPCLESYQLPDQSTESDMAEPPVEQLTFAVDAKSHDESS